MRILINDNDYSILVNLQSNVSITGSYVDAKQGAIDRLEKLLSTQLNNAIGSTSSQILNRFNQTALQSASTTTNLTALVSSEPSNVVSVPSVTNRRIINYSKNIFNGAAVASTEIQSIPVNALSIVDNIVVIPPKDTYEYIKNYFDAKLFYYVTGYTTSKYNDLITSFVDFGYSDSKVVSKVGNYDNTLANQVERSSMANAPISANSIDRLIVPNNVGSISGGSSISVNRFGSVSASVANESVISAGKYENIIKHEIDDTYKTHKKILLHGTDIYGMILNIGTYKEYVLYVGTDYPIKYIDFPDGRTKFMYRRSSDVETNKANIILYPGLVEEPKILNEVFIDRGVNNAFEPVKRLKNVSTLNELVKIGLGYYKMNTKGFNFKNTQ